MPVSIDFERIKPHRGDRRWAFEELCYLLFAEDFRSSGEAIRREGAGGDGGIEGYIHDGAGRVKIGMQSKFFVGAAFESGWWSKMNKSVQDALAANTHHGVMERYVICTPRILTKKQRYRWDGLCLEWMGYAITLGYPTAPEFTHWGYSELESKLLQPAMRGHLLYWFGFPNFNNERCAHLNHATIVGLHERFMPGLHTPTECEVQLHRFLRTERFWQEFVKEKRKVVGRAREGSWMTRDDWPKVVKPFVVDAKSKFATVVQFLGDGCHFPASLQELAAAGTNFDASADHLYDALSDYAEKQKSKRVSPAKAPPKTTKELTAPKS